MFWQTLHNLYAAFAMGKEGCRANVGHSLAAFRNVSFSQLRLSGVNEILSTLRNFATKPYELLKFCILS